MRLSGRRWGSNLYLRKSHRKLILASKRLSETRRYRRRIIDIRWKFIQDRERKLDSGNSSFESTQAVESLWYVSDPIGIGKEMSRVRQQELFIEMRNVSLSINSYWWAALAQVLFLVTSERHHWTSLREPRREIVEAKSKTRPPRRWRRPNLSTSHLARVLGWAFCSTYFSQCDCSSACESHFWWRKRLLPRAYDCYLWAGQAPFLDDLIEVLQRISRSPVAVDW